MTDIIDFAASQMADTIRMDQRRTAFIEWVRDDMALLKGEA